MLRVIPFRFKKEICELDFVNEDLQTIVITPSPVVADDLRFLLGQFGKSPEVITISKFLSSYLAESEIELEQTRKSDLMLLLSVVWKDKFSDLPDESFFLAFKQFTELRSFTLSLELVEEALVSFDSRIATAIQYFWTICESLKIVDEQNAYQLIAESFRSIPEVPREKRKNLLFWGFNHLNAGQVDLVKSLGIGNDVFIPFPEEVLSHTHPSDWINWLDVDLPEPGLFDDVDGDLKVIEFSKGRLSESLRTFFLDKTEDADFYLGMKKPTLKEVMEVSKDNLNFKSPSNILIDLHKGLFSKLAEVFPTGGQTNDLFKELDESILKLKDENQFRELKLLLLVKAKIENWKELSDKNSKFSEFDLKVLLNVTELDLPRTFLISLSEKSETGNLYGVDALSRIDKSKKNIFVAHSGYQPIRGRESMQAEDMFEFMNAIGPIKRKELDYLILKQELKEVLGCESSFLFLENGLVEHDSGWSEIIDCFGENVEFSQQGQHLFEVKKCALSKRQKSGPFDIPYTSASRLQKFLDCPRSYYFSYIEKIYERPVVNTVVPLNEIGTLEHEVIQLYLEDTREWDEKKHFNLVETSFNKLLKTKGFNLSEGDYIKSLMEIKTYSRNGIFSVLELVRSVPEIEIEFEKPIKIEGTKGSIDLFFKSPLGWGILDFKRSEGSIPSGKELSEFGKVQLWYYANRLGLPIENNLVFGYLNLSEPASSLIFCQHDDIQNNLVENSFANSYKFPKKAFPIENLYNDYLGFEEELIKNLECEEQFLAIPKNDKVCNFCPVRLICERGK